MKIWDSVYIYYWLGLIQYYSWTQYYVQLLWYYSIHLFSVTFGIVLLLHQVRYLMLRNIYVMFSQTYNLCCFQTFKANAIINWNIWIANFYLFVILMVGYSDARYHGTRQINSGEVFKSWSEYLSVNQSVISIANHFTSKQIPHDLNPKLVRYSDPLTV